MTTHPKITLIGAGSMVFTRNLCNDIALTPALHNCTISLMDIDPSRLEQARQIVQTIIDMRGVGIQLEITLDRREAIRNADYIITTFQQGGLEAFKLDIEIPLRYGVEQCVGDTLGPGGVLRALRTIPELIDLCHEMDDLAPDALLLNYVNPMAANCWAVDVATGRPMVGLCHSVQMTSEMLAEWVDVPYEEVIYHYAGINHQAWLLEFRREREDLYPLIWKALDQPENYAREPVRIEMMRYFGYFVTESSGHASEYVPYFRKSTRMVNEDLVPLFTDQHNFWFEFGATGGYLHFCTKWFEDAQADFQRMLAKVKELPEKRTHEYGSFIIEAIETNRPVCIYGNVRNWGLIDNLPRGCCVEVPCMIDGKGIQPTAIGSLPVQLAALNRTNINVQELMVEAALGGDIEPVYHAVMLDPLTAAVCTLPQIRSMVDELMVAQAQWLPQFR